MNQITKKLLLSVLTVVLTVIALGTTTFAWFTLTDVATVQPIDVQVVADVGMEISLDEETWVTTLTTSMINDFLYDPITGPYPSGLRLNNITSPDGFNFTNLDATAAALSSYLRLPIYFRSNNVESVAWTLVSLQSQGVSWLSDVAFADTHGAVTAGSNLVYVAAQGARVSVRGETGVTATAVYELGTGIAGNYGALAPTRNNTPLSGVVGPFLSTEPGAINYYYVKTTELPLGADAIGGITLATTVSTLGTGIDVLDLILGYEGNNPAAYAAYTYGGRMSIYLWLEGWDPDTFNAVLADTVRVRFEFKDFATITP